MLNSANFGFALLYSVLITAKIVWSLLVPLISSFVLAALPIGISE